MKTELVQGFIPEGWVRGEDLVIHSPPLYSDRRVTRGYVTRKYTVSVVDTNLSKRNPHIYTFESTETNTVQEWLNWWHSSSTT
jgi:hypothetical protein